MGFHAQFSFHIFFKNHLNFTFTCKKKQQLLTINFHSSISWNSVVHLHTQTNISCKICVLNAMHTYTHTYENTYDETKASRKNLHFFSRMCVYVFFFHVTNILNLEDNRNRMQKTNCIKFYAEREHNHPKQIYI